MPVESAIARARALLASLFPRGRALLIRPDNSTRRFLEPIAIEMARARERIDDLAAEALPSTCVEMLPEWEDALGLPDPDLPTPSTTEARQIAVQAKLLDAIGHTEADIRALALTYGYDHLTFTHYFQAECGVAECGVTAMTNEFFGHVVLITLRYGDYDEAVQAAILRLKRAHADFWFEFVAPPVPLLIDGVPLLIDGLELLI